MIDMDHSAAMAIIADERMHVLWAALDTPAGRAVIDVMTDDHQWWAIPSFVDLADALRDAWAADRPGGPPSGPFPPDAYTTPERDQRTGSMWRVDNIATALCVLFDVVNAPGVRGEAYGVDAQALCDMDGTMHRNGIVDDDRPGIRHTP